MKNSYKHLKLSFFSLAFILLQPFAALAVDYEYIYNGGASSALWSSTSSAVWSPVAPTGGPTASDNVSIPNVTLKTLAIDGARSVGNFTFLKADAFNVVGGAAGNNTLGIVGNFTKSGAGELTFRASGTSLLGLSVGNLTISSGTVNMGSTTVAVESLDVSGSTSLSGSSVLNVNIVAGRTASLGALSMDTGTFMNIRNASSGTATTEVTSLSGSGLIRNAISGGTGTGILVINSTGSSDFSGSIINNSSSNVDSTLQIVKSGLGTQTLSGNNSYSGGTTINTGTLLLTHASGAGSGAVALTGGNLHVNINSGNGTITNVVTFRSESSTYQLERAAGQSLSALSAASDLTGGIDTTASILQGTAGSARTLTSSFTAAELSLSSDIFSLSGIPDNSDVFVLQLQVAAGVTLDSYLAWWNGASWVNAVSGNTGGSGSFQGNGAYNGGLFTLGNWGVDTTTNSVWAVLNHNSEFAIAVVPEPATWSLVVIASAAFLIRRRLRS